MAVEKEFVECLIKSVWLDRPRYEEAETVFCEILAKSHAGLKVEGKAVLSKKGTSDIEDVIGEARSMIEQSLRAVSSKPTGSHKKLERRVAELEEENAALKKRVASLEKQLASVSNKEVSKQEENDDDDDFDLFGSDEDEEEAEKLKQERIEAYNRKKASS